MLGEDGSWLVSPGSTSQGKRLEISLPTSRVAPAVKECAARSGSPEHQCATSPTMRWRASDFVARPQVEGDLAGRSARYQSQMRSAATRVCATAAPPVTARRTAHQRRTRRADKTVAGKKKAVGSSDAKPKPGFAASAPRERRTSPTAWPHQSSFNTRSARITTRGKHPRVACSGTSASRARASPAFAPDGIRPCARRAMETGRKVDGW